MVLVIGSQRLLFIIEAVEALKLNSSDKGGVRDQRLLFIIESIETLKLNSKDKGGILIKSKWRRLVHSIFMLRTKSIGS